MNFSPKKSLVQACVVAVFILLLYTLGYLYPDEFWAFHFPAFLPGGWGLILIVVAVLLSTAGLRWTPESFQFIRKYDKFWLYVLPVLVGIAVYQLPMFMDVYGDSKYIVPEPDSIIREFPQKHLDHLLDFNLTNPKVGTATTTGLTGLLAYYMGISVGETFRLLEALCAVVFVFLMLSIVKKQVQNEAQRVVLILMCISTPLLMFFCRHYEIYFPVYVILAGIWLSVINYFNKPSVVRLLIVAALSLLYVKFHVSAIAVAPVLGLIVIGHFFAKKGFWEKLSWKRLIRWLVLPAYTLGAFVYVFITKSANGPRSFTPDNLTDAIFLPIQAAEPAPLDNYNLLSWNHISDYLSTFFIWSAPAVLIIVILLVFHRKRLDTSQPILKVVTYGLLMVIPLFFVLNPLLSMQVDMDLMVIPGVTFMVFAIVLTSTYKAKEEARNSLFSYLVLPVLGLVLLSWTGLVVNNNKKMLSEHTISMGIRSYKTYWRGSSTSILEGLSLKETDKERSERLHQVLQELEPLAVPGNDLEMSELKRWMALYDHQSGANAFQVKEHLESGFKYDSLNINLVNDIVAFHVAQHDYKGAFRYVSLMARMQYPSKEEALKTAIQISINAGEVNSAIDFCDVYLAEYPADSEIQTVRNQLLNRSNPPANRH